MTLQEIIQSRRDTRHFTSDAVPEEVIQQALQAGHYAPSVGLTDATRYYIIRKAEVKKAIKVLFDGYDAKAANMTDNEKQKQQYQALKLEAIKVLFDGYDAKAANMTDNEKQKQQYQTLKLEAIEEAPLGLVIAYDRSVLNTFTIGTVGSNEAIKNSAVCAAQNIWLSLTEQGYSMGWVSILNYHEFKSILGLPENIEPLGYFCVGKPASNYDNQPMLQQLGWKKKAAFPLVSTIDTIQQVVETENKEIKPIEFNNSLSNELKFKIDNKTKPTGALGDLESLAHQIGMVMQTTCPKIVQPHLIVFAADHGIANHGVSAYPQEVTRQMVTNFLDGGAAINVFCKQNDIGLTIVDAGVNYDFPTNINLINAKIGKGTQSFLHTSAMSLLEVQKCFQAGASIVASIGQKGTNCIGFGEMGIGNTATASVLMHVLTQIPLEDCIGKGTGVSDEKLKTKHQILAEAISNYQGSNELDALLAYFGGFEILQMAGGMLEAYQKNMLILVDGFIASVAFLIAFKKNPAIKSHAIFCHASAEKGHQKLLTYLDAKALLHLELRLGEGTGCALAFPLVQSAVAFLNEMASFESAGVNSKKD